MAARSSANSFNPRHRHPADIPHDLARQLLLSLPDGGQDPMTLALDFVMTIATVLFLGGTLLVFDAVRRCVTGFRGSSRESARSSSIQRVPVAGARLSLTTPS